MRKVFTPSKAKSNLNQSNNEVDDELTVSSIEQSFKTIAKSYQVMTDSSLEDLKLEDELKDKQIEKLMKQLEDSNSKLLTLKGNMKEKLSEKEALLAYVGARNVTKREDRKIEKIKKLQEEVKQLQDKVTRFDFKVIKLQTKDNALRSKVSYYKNKLEIVTSKLVKSQEDCIFYGNLSCEHQAKVDDFDRTSVKTFHDGKCTEEIRTVYYEMLR